MSGCVDDEPEPVVLGGLAGRTGVVAVADGEVPLLAVVPLLFQPAIIRKPISTNTATPAIQPTGIIVSAHHGVTQPRIRISKTWISHGPPPWFGTLCVASNEGNPLTVAAVPKE